MKSILLIIPYIGKWPLWFDAHLVSMAKNPTINWLFITDCEIPEKFPENVQFIKTTFVELNQKINNSLDVKVVLSARKLCDIRPAFGKIFKEYIDGYHFWGFCDVDIIWGNIRKFITDDLLEEYDIISALENMACGHFTIFKNHEKNLNIYKNDPDYKKVFEAPKHLRYDEIGLTNIITKLCEEGQTKILWDEKLLKNGIKSEVHQEYFLDRWLYENDSVYDLYDSNKKEYMYLHFINWKRTMKFCEVSYTDNPHQFYISYNGMHYQPHSKISRILNDFKNRFNGYWVQQYWRYKKMRLNSLKKRINRKIELAIKNII
ncbi:MAG: hypothetical protein JJE55_13055 [Flavobacteriaceae bacterium]|nr:hypothetical protein [Flavobacteriaceae bacterium]